MMVTFVSQCEKKALARTRRILDAFANRIGDSTWQTIITQEGLNAVRKLLRKTASKSTAVSCHWIRSRSRSDLLWVVGSKLKFDYQGGVPVNTTTKQVIMDKLSIETDKILANSHGQPLSQHLFAVGYVAYKLLDMLVSDCPKITQSALIGGFMHDIGKLDCHFQSWVSKKQGKTEERHLPEDGVHIDKGRFSFEKHPRHNEISLLIHYALLGGDGLNQQQLRNNIPHCIYWHHAKVFRKNPLEYVEDIYRKFKENLGNSSEEHFFDQAKQLLMEIFSIARSYDNTLPIPDKLLREKPAIDEAEIENTPLPIFKKYSSGTLADYQKDVKKNADNNLVRFAVISADRVVSELSKEDLLSHIKCRTLESLITDRLNVEDGLKSNIQSSLRIFESKFPNSERNKSQEDAARKLSETKYVAVLSGPAGCGKTKIALEWASNQSARKIVWICPRVLVCLGLFSQLSTEEYLSNSNVEIFTGDYKQTIRDNEKTDTEESRYFSGDIVITTIDQAVNLITSHNGIPSFMQLMNAHVVFDEFHELINMPAFNLLFAELIACKRRRGSEANTLLVSATPNYFFVRDFMEIDQDDIVAVDSFNRSEYEFDFETYDEGVGEANPLLAAKKSSSVFVITNTARDAQLGFVNHLAEENGILLHSKYKKDDKREWFDKVFDSFKQGGSRQFDVLRSGPIVQASLDITCDRMFTEFTSPENWLQRLGRLNRFAENNTGNCYTTVVPTQQRNSCENFLNQQNLLNATKAWHEFVSNKLDGRSFQLSEIYSLYAGFYEDEDSIKSVEKDFLQALKHSVDIIKRNLIDPVTVPLKKRQREKNSTKIKKQSLRGNSRYVQMAVCDISDGGELCFPNRYAYPEDTDHTDVDVGLTASVESITGYRDSGNDLVAFMKQKHHNIKKDQGAKKVRKDFELLERARSPENPIYLSYTQEDLEKVGGKDVAHQAAIYYAVSDKQPIGAISKSSLDGLKHGLPTITEDG